MSDYSNWLAKQSKDFQNDTLGAEKAAKFRDGSLTLDKFENPKPLTLDDFKSKRKLISETANGDNIGNSNAPSS